MGHGAILKPSRACGSSRVFALSERTDRRSRICGTNSVSMTVNRRSSRPGWRSNAAPANSAAMADPRIIDIELDERSILRRNADIEQERQIAIFDLLEDNHFDVAGHDGPFRILLARRGRPARDRRCATRPARPRHDPHRPRPLPPPDPRLFRDLRFLFQGGPRRRRQGHRGDRHGPPRASTTRPPSCSRSASQARSRWISTPPGGCSP